MHGKRTLVKEVRYGANGTNIFLRLDFADEAASLEGLEIQAETAGANGKADPRVKVILKAGVALVESTEGEAAFRDVMEISFPAHEDSARVRLSVWQDGLPIQAIPPQDFLQISLPSGWNA